MASGVSIKEFEDAIDFAYNDYVEAFEALYGSITTMQGQNSIEPYCISAHKKAVSYFNLFERSLDEYGNKGLEATEDTKIRKSEDALNIAHLIIRHWSFLEQISQSYDIRKPNPSASAYSSLQRFINTEKPDQANELRKKFEQLNLPIDGFKSQTKHGLMNSKKQIGLGLILGSVFLVALLIITLLIQCPTQFQNSVFRIILSLAGAAFSIIIPGALNVSYRGIITAGGSMAVFVIIYFFQPAEISDFSNCINRVAGSVYLNDKPASLVQLRFLDIDKTTNANTNGNFDLEVDRNSIDEEIRIHLTRDFPSSNDKEIDTVIVFRKNQLKENLKIILPLYCASCTQSDTAGTLVNRKEKCSANSKYIGDYVAGYLAAGKKRGNLAECQTRKL